MAFAAVAHTQKASVNANDVTTDAIDTTGADLLVAHVSVEVGGGTFSDSKGNTWNIAVGPTSSSRADSVMYWCSPTSVGSGHTFTYSKTADSPNLCVEAFSGFASGTVDQTNSATATSAANIQPGSITPSVDNCLVVSGFGHDNGTVGSVTGYTLTDTNAGAGGQAWGASMAYQIQTTATATNPSWSTGAGSADSATIVSFKAGSGAAPATKIQFRAAGAQAAANSTPQSPALPTGHAAGDVLLLFCSQASAAAVTFTPPAGWTSIARNSDATRAMTIEVFAKIDNGSESAPSVAVSAATAGWTAQIGGWYNVDDGFIEDAADVSSNAAAAATFQPTGITTNTANAWVLSYVCSKDDNALNYNNQNGYSDRMSGANYDTTLGNGSDQSIGVADKEFASPGAQTCPTWNQSTNGNDAWVALTLALRPKTLVWGARPDGYLGHSLMMQLLAT